VVQYNYSNDRAGHKETIEVVTTFKPSEFYANAETIAETYEQW
jgi:hypothetical protein